MKKLLVGLILAIVIPISGYCDVNKATQEIVDKVESKWQFRTEVYQMFPADPENIVRKRMGYQLTTVYKNFLVYYSEDTGQIGHVGQGGDDIKIQSLGAGFTWSHRVAEKGVFSFDIDAGYYKFSGDGIAHSKDPMSENLNRYLNQNVPYNQHYDVYFWENTRVEYKDSFGGKIAIRYEHEWTKNLSSGLGVKYLILKTQENIYGWNNVDTFGRWDYLKERNFGGFQIAVDLLTVRF